MNGERLESLLWEREDQTITGRDLAELELFLETHDEAQSIAQQVHTLGQSLASAEAIEPPADLRRRIGLALDAARSPLPQPTAPATRIVRPPQWRARFLPLAAGLVLGALLTQLLHLMPNRPVPESSAAGAIVPTVTGQAAASLQVTLDGGVGTLSASRSGDLLTIDLELRAAAEIEVSVQAAEGRLEIVSFSSSGTHERVESTGDGGIVLGAGGPGQHHLTAAVGSRDAGLRLEVQMNDQRATEHWLEADLGMRR